MIQISYWARRNPKKARIYIILLHIMLMGLAIYTGTGLLEFGLIIPAWLPYALLPLFISLCFFYPSHNNIKTGFSRMRKYRLQKSLDLCSAIFSFVLICYVANNISLPFISTASGARIETSKKNNSKPTAEEILASLSHRDKSTLTRSEKRILKSEFKKQLKVYVKAKLTKDDEAAAKAVFIILSIIGAVGLTILLAALACNLACNGSEAGAILLLLLGISAIVFLLILVIKKIKSHKKPDTESTPAPKTEGQ
jgi:hypothetical protein